MIPGSITSAYRRRFHLCQVCDARSRLGHNGEDFALGFPEPNRSGCLGRRYSHKVNAVFASSQAALRHAAGCASATAAQQQLAHKAAYACWVGGRSPLLPIPSRSYAGMGATKKVFARPIQEDSV